MDARSTSNEAHRLLHELENDLAAIRIRADLLIGTVPNGESSTSSLVESDLVKLRGIAEHATTTAQEFARIITESEQTAMDIGTSDRTPSSTSPDARVLYVEDNAANVDLMQRLFRERPSLELLIATDGASARDLAKTALPQLVLVDVNLPDMSGEELIVHMQNDIGEQTPPIVVLSADAMSDTIDRLRSLGIAEYMTKPYDVQHLFDVIDSHCK